VVVVFFVFVFWGGPPRDWPQPPKPQKKKVVKCWFCSSVCLGKKGLVLQLAKNPKKHPFTKQRNQTQNRGVFKKRLWGENTGFFLGVWGPPPGGSFPTFWGWGVYTQIYTLSRLFVQGGGCGGGPGDGFFGGSVFVGGGGFGQGGRGVRVCWGFGGWGEIGGRTVAKPQKKNKRVERFCPF